MLNVITLEEALALIRREFVPAAAPERVPLGRALGRTLAEDVLAQEYVPDFDRSTVDGYALRARDTFGCSDAIPAILTRQGSIRMGEGAGFVLQEGCCASIPTGGALPQGADSVELLCRAESFAVGLVDLLNEYGLSANYSLRRNRYVVYLKEGDSVTGFLALIGSNTAALDLENVRAEKETRNYVNRTTNCEYANLDKLVAASVKQQQAVNTILSHGHFQRLPKALKEAAELRLNYPDASLQELADMADIKKSGMNHRLTRLVEYAQDLENGLI